MDNALQTLFYPFEHGDADAPAPDARCLFLNARYHSYLANLNVLCVQGFKPWADALAAAHCPVEAFMDEDEGDFDLAFVLLPKNKVEAAYMVAQGIDVLAEGGRLVCAADNKAGGGHIGKMLAGFGFDAVEVDSKNKARVALVEKNADVLDTDAVEAALAAGSVQKVLDGQYVSQPGVYGWDKIDRGSALLMEHLPNDIGGDIADFGCGYGFLALGLLQRYGSQIGTFSAIEADARALACCRENLQEIQGPEKQGLWVDLTTPHEELMEAFDVVIMNPPFHEGKRSDSDIGKAFIESAHFSLKKGGRLYMVANTHLPYEPFLNDLYRTVEKLFEGQGFKIYKAVK